MTSNKNMKETGQRHQESQNKELISFVPKAFRNHNIL